MKNKLICRKCGEERLAQNLLSEKVARHLLFKGEEIMQEKQQAALGHSTYSISASFTLHSTGPNNHCT